MKKAIITIIMCLTFSFVILAQSIVVDKTDSNGIRTIISSDFNIYTTLYTGGSACLMYNDSIGYFLSLTLNEGYIPQIETGRKLLLKFENEEILELENKSNISSYDYTFYCNQFGTRYNIHPIYYLSNGDITKIINNNVIKIRIETDLEELDKKIKKGKLSKGLSKSLKIIKERLSIKKDIYSNF